MVAFPLHKQMDKRWPPIAWVALLSKNIVQASMVKECDLATVYKICYIAHTRPILLSILHVLIIVQRSLKFKVHHYAYTRTDAHADSIVYCGSDGGQPVQPQ